MPPQDNFNQPPMAMHPKSRWRILAEQGARLSAGNTRPQSQEEAERFGALFRQGATELARVKAFSPDRRLGEALEQAVATGHFAMHRGERASWQDALKGFFFLVPQLVRRNWAYMATSAAITFISALIAFVAVQLDESTFYLFIDPGLAGGRDPSASREALKASLEGGMDSLGEGAAFSSFLFVHNTKVAFICFALGALLGLPTTYMLIKNGLMLGAFIAIYEEAGLLPEVLAWLLPHGVPEFGAIILCGGCGLMLGHRMLNPGSQPRRVAMPKYATQACIIAMGCVPLLYTAGIIEGIFRQSGASIGLRYTLFAAMLLLIGSWLLFAGRGRDPESTASRS